MLNEVFGHCKFAKRPCTVMCKGHSMEIIEEQGLSTRKQAEINYATVCLSFCVSLSTLIILLSCSSVPLPGIMLIQK